MLSSPPELWLHAALAEVFVLMADDDPNIQSKLTSEVKEMCRLVGQSDPDDVNQVQYRYERMIGWWKESLSPVVVSAARTTVNALRAAVEREAKKKAKSQSPSVAESDPFIEPELVPLKRPEPPEPELKIDRRNDLLRHGPDDRVAISNAAEVFPAYCLCKIQTTLSDGTSSSGTGWLVGPRLIITAAHVVHSPGKQTESVSIWFARNGNVQGEQYQKVIPIRLNAKDAVKLPEGLESATPDYYDYAAIVLPPEHSHSLSRYFSFKALPDDELENTCLTLMGYPIVPPKKYQSAEGQPAQQTEKPEQTDQTRPDQRCDENYIYYLLHATGGQSGGPVYVNIAPPCTVVGIHIQARTSDCVAIRITPQVKCFIEKYLK